MKKQPNITLVIDGDIIAYQAAVVCQRPVNWGDGLWTLHGHEGEAALAMDDRIAKLKAESGAKDVVIALTDKVNYRTSVSADYKGNRKDTLKPILLNYAKEYLVKEHSAIRWPNLEADDILGILGTSNRKYVIWSIDKDMKTLPCRQFIDGEIVEFTEEEADKVFFAQVLTGDSTDNYGGCPKVGEVGAKKILDKAIEDGEYLWNAVVAAFKKADKTELDALTQARLARILRHGEYNKKTKQPILWNPK
jgi:DNA polymerase I